MSEDKYHPINLIVWTIMAFVCFSWIYLIPSLIFYDKADFQNLISDPATPYPGDVVKVTLSPSTEKVELKNNKTEVKISELERDAKVYITYEQQKIDNIVKYKVSPVTGRRISGPMAVTESREVAIVEYIRKVNIEIPDKFDIKDKITIISKDKDGEIIEELDIRVYNPDYITRTFGKVLNFLYYFTIVFSIIGAFGMAFIFYMAQ